jgi:hypothetical protein
MRDVYRSGRFDEAIDVILSQADVVRRIYKEVSGAERAADWLPQESLDFGGRLRGRSITDHIALHNTGRGNQRDAFERSCDSYYSPLRDVRT